MKKGTGDDPFADDDADPEDSEESESVESTGGKSSVLADTAPGATDDESRASSTAGDDLPYLARRQLKNKSVKADRDQVPFFLRENVQQGERTLRRDVEELLGQEVGKTDLREAAYVYAQRNPEGVAEILREWGVEYLD